MLILGVVPSLFCPSFIVVLINFTVIILSTCVIRIVSLLFAHTARFKDFSIVLSTYEVEFSIMYSQQAHGNLHQPGFWKNAILEASFCATVKL